MDRTQKETFVTELRERVDRAPVMYLTDFTGLDVKAMSALRRSLKQSGARVRGREESPRHAGVRGDRGLPGHQ